jgi:UDP-glucose 4-epimerase
MPHVVVTGGAGFIGSHVSEAFLARGWRVSVVDDLSTGRAANVPAGAELHVADVCSPDAGDLIRSLAPDVISHHAAQIDVRKSVADPARDAELNIVATLRLLEVARELAVQRFVFASTGGAIYGEPETAPQDESHPARPMSPYGCAKLSVEHYLHYYREVFGVPTVALRYGNVYGPRQNPHGEAGVIAIFANRMLAAKPVIINGSGLQTRDYVFVTDVAAANVAAVEHELTGSWNVGTGVETNVNELFAALATALGVKGEGAHGPAKPGEQMRSVLDGTRLRSHTGLAEPVKFADGLARTAEWFKAEAP